MSPDYLSKGGDCVKQHPPLPVTKLTEMFDVMDINHDGKVDDKDASLAGKVLSNTAKVSTTNSIPENYLEEKSKGDVTHESDKLRRKMVPGKRKSRVKE